MKFLVFTRPIEGIEKSSRVPGNSRRRSDGFVSSLTRAASIAPITARTTPWRSSMPSNART